MVAIAIAGASGGVAREVIDGLLATGKHTLLLLSTRGGPGGNADPNVRWRKTSYEVDDLAAALEGVHTVLCFITPQSDPGNKSQRSLIDAAVRAGVKRFAPSEWATSSFEHMPWYAGKASIRKYLADLNKDGPVLEYSLFQAGMFTNYLVAPHQTARHVHAFQNHMDLQNRRVLTVKGRNDARLSLITAEDFVNVVVAAVGYEGVWPVNGGVRGDELSVGEIIALGEEVRSGGSFAVEELDAADLEAGRVLSTWMPRPDHTAIPKDKLDELASVFTSGMMLGISLGAMQVSDEWNRLLPEYKFTSAREFLTAAWRGKP